MPDSLGIVGGPTPVGGAIGITRRVARVRLGRCGWGEVEAGGSMSKVCEVGLGYFRPGLKMKEKGWHYQ